MSWGLSLITHSPKPTTLSPSMASSFTTLVNPLFYHFLFPRFLGNQTGLNSLTNSPHFQFYSSHFSLWLVLLWILQSHVGCLSAPPKMGLVGPTYNSVKLRRLPSPLSFVPGSLRISPLTSSSIPSSRRRPGLLTSVRASAEVRVFFLL